MERVDVIDMRRCPVHDLVLIRQEQDWEDSGGNRRSDVWYECPDDDCEYEAKS